jgi:serine/threonine protein kinase/Tol biopolymer transport system component
VLKLAAHPSFSNALRLAFLWHLGNIANPLKAQGISNARERSVGAMSLDRVQNGSKLSKQKAVGPLESSRNVVRFEAFELDLRARELRRGGLNTGLPEQSIRILALLVERPGDVVLREEIRKRLWPNDTVVEFDHSINAAMKRLRQALGDSADDPRFIETLARRGYRWKVPVQSVESPLKVAAPTSASSAPPAAGNLIGRKVSHYRVIEPLGGGGMGVVYRAEDLKLGRGVALKFLPEELARDTTALSRFEREARAASALNHPNICTIYTVGEHQGQPFIVMELLEGCTLRERIADEKSSPESDTKQASFQIQRLLDVAVQIAEGLEAAHQKGIIHRDIKPANIFITNHGVVKILDFGLAKLQESGTPDEPTDGKKQPHQEWSPDLTLTGTTVGTQGYMSPEQVRGEKLDWRTDLFSFGIVLYEMATGQRAFRGETAAVLREAILTHTPIPARELNPQIPAKLEAIINRASEKDRELRYQSASEIRAALEELRPKTGSNRRFVQWSAIVLGTLLLAAIGVWFWLSARKGSGVQGLPELKQVQLTANSIENWVGDSAISPDGKLLAFADRRTIQIKEIVTGAVRSIPPPDVPPGAGLPFGSVIFAWFPDSLHLAVTVNTTVINQPDSTVSGQCTGIWILSLLGEPPRKLRDDGCIGSISPDGVRIAFARGGHRSDQFGNEVWLMGPNGEQPHRIFEGDEHSRYDVVRWSPDGRRLVYARSHESGTSFQQVVQSRDLRGGSPVTMIPSGVYVDDFCWLPGGRLIQSVPEPMNQGENFWETPVNPETGKPHGKSRRLTNWSSVFLANFSASADGKRIAFFRHSSEGSVYVGDLLPGSRMTTPRHLTLSEEWNGATAWTPDNKAVIIASERNRANSILKQSLESEEPETIITGLSTLPVPRVSPDGASLLFIVDRNFGGEPASAALVRIPITGGTPEFVLTVQPGARLSCAKSPATLCVISAQSLDSKQLVLTALDPLAGRSWELMRLNGTINETYLWDVSPDGTRIAFTRSADAPIEILRMSGGSAGEINPKGWTTTESLAWTADGKGIFISGLSHNSETLLRIDLGGQVHTLWSSRSGQINVGAPSPDGRHLAITQTQRVGGNIWMIEDF